MKNLIIILSTVLSFSSCSQNDNNKIENNTLVGTWKLIERFDGGSVNPTQIIEGGKTIQFLEDDSFVDSSINCNGTFTTNNSELSINIPCETQTNLTYNYSFDNGNLLLTDTPSTCDEGCYNKFERRK